MLRCLLLAEVLVDVESLLHDAVVLCHDVRRRWIDVLYCPLEVCDDGLGEEVVVGCHSFREIFGEKILIFFEFVLLLLSKFIVQLLLPLPLFYSILRRLEECWW